MAAPEATVRGTPGGKKLQDGFSTLITLALDATIEFWEKSGPPPGIEGGDPIDQTTMHNEVWKTWQPRALKTLEPFTVTVAYDPICYGGDAADESVLEAINRNDTITVTFPDGTTLAFFGYLQNFLPQDHVEGEQPEAQVTLVPTNYDPVNDVEAGPVMVNITGT